MENALHQHPILILKDERLAPERAHALSRLLASLKEKLPIELMEGDASEAQILERLNRGPVSVLLMPWHRYLKALKIEAQFGLKRQSGPSFGGYFAEPISAQELGAEPSRDRLILLDWTHMNAHEAAIWLRSFADENRRSGILPLVRDGNAVFGAAWFGDSSPGPTLDGIMRIPQLQESPWKERMGSVRMLVMGLWSLIFDEGPGKLSDLGGAKAAKAQLQVTLDSQTLAMRCCYGMPGWKKNGWVEAVRTFWPAAAVPGGATNAIFNYADSVRVHIVGDSSDVEITVTLQASAPSKLAPQKVRQLWVDPISPKLVEPLLAPGSGKGSPAALTQPGTFAHLPAPTANGPNPETDKLKKLLGQASVKLQELKTAILDKDKVIRELRSGGVGTAQPLPPPDTSSLLDAFTERYFEAQLQIRKVEVAFENAKNNGATPAQIEALQKRVTALTRLEKDWIEKLQKVLESYAKSDRKAGGDS
ncbi:MAG: hypothetical protein JNL01_00885 [Bdellovibrionales bacterium]|nr:hypothetical protein [Bdellovibrionales bacterium]